MINLLIYVLLLQGGIIELWLFLVLVVLGTMNFMMKLFEKPKEYDFKSPNAGSQAITKAVMIIILGVFCWYFGVNL